MVEKHHSYEVCVGGAGHEIMHDTLTNNAYYLLRMYMYILICILYVYHTIHTPKSLGNVQSGVVNDNLCVSLCACSSTHIVRCVLAPCSHVVYSSCMNIHNSSMWLDTCLVCCRLNTVFISHNVFGEHFYSSYLHVTSNHG